MKWDKTIKILFIFVISYLGHKYYKEQIQEKNLIICNQTEIVKTYEKWINKLNKKRSLDSYLGENGYYNVAIYGLGSLGKQLYRELSGSNVQVIYGIDNNISNYENLPCYGLNEDLPQVDLIIVTVLVGTSNIISELKKRVPCSVQSINDILFMI